MKLSHALTVTLLTVALALTLTAQPALAQADGLNVTARLDGTALAEADGNNPVRLNARDQVQLELDIQNTTTEQINIGRVSLNGNLLGMSFLKHDTAVAYDINAGAQRTVTIPLAFFDIDDDATGYLRGTLVLRSVDGDRLNSTDFALDVRGEGISTMTKFAIGLAVIAGATIASNLWALATRVLPKNRSMRGMRFALSGLCIGVLICALCSVMRIFPLAPLASILVMAGGAVIGFVIGMVTPGPVEMTDEDVLENIMIDLAEAKSVAH